MTPVHVLFRLPALLAACALLSGLAVRAAFTTNGRQLLRDGQPFQVRGVGYQPTPIGDNPSTMAPNGDYFTAAYGAVTARDLPLLRQLGANVIRIYGWNPAADHTAFLDACYNGGVDSVFVLVNRWINPATAWSSSSAVDAIRQEYLALDAGLAHHPAVLGIVLGNEVNATNGNGDNAAYWSAMNSIAGSIKLQNPRRLVSVAISDAVPQIAAHDAAMTALDFWSVQVYRGTTFGSFFTQYAAVSSRPLVLTEFGADAFNQNTGQPYPDNGEFVGATVAGLWNEIAANQAVCAGGCVFEFSDEWWKTSAGAAATHDTGGFALAGLPDGFANEEWWGLYAVTDNGAAPDILTARATVARLRTLWTAAPLITTHPSAQATTAGGTTSFTAAASGAPAPTCQWQRAPAGSSTFVDLPEGGSYAGVTTATLTVAAATGAMNGDQFRCVASNIAGAATSNAATLTVVTPLAAAGGTQPGAVSSGQMLLFQVTVPAGYPGMRVVLSTTGFGDADLYVQRGTSVATGNYLKASIGNAGSDTLILTDAESSAGTYTIGVNRPAGQTGTLNFTLYFERGWYVAGGWDAGDGAAAAIRPLPAQVAQDLYFRVIVPANGADLGALVAVASASDGGTVRLYGGADYVPTPTSKNAASERTGSNGFVLAENQFGASQTWIFLVRYTPGELTVLPEISLRVGEAEVRDLGAMSATEGANSGDVAMPVEGMVFFKTTVPAATPAWALWARTNTAAGTPLTNAACPLAVRRLKVPVGAYRDIASDHGQMLVVPAYLNANGDTYFVSIVGEPGARFNLASYRQPVGTMPFSIASFPVALPADTFLFKTYRVEVPVDQLAWDLTANSSGGNLQLAVRRADVPNPFNNDAFVEALAGVDDGLTVAPPDLSDGTWYVTVYSDGNAAAGTLRSGAPVVTDIPFLSEQTNDQTGKSGWRYYRVTDLPGQLGYLGWELLLSAPVEDRLLAIRANAVPVRRQYRQNNQTQILTGDRFDASSAIGHVQRPAHQSDVWYIGVYRPDAALGAFQLRARALAAQAGDFQTTQSVAGQPAGIWNFYRIEVPAGVLGWDVRLIDVTGGSPQLVVRRDQLPGGLSTTRGESWPPGLSLPASATGWPSGNQWASQDDLTGDRYSADGVDERGRILHLGTGRPLEPGTYYVGVTNASDSTAAMSYTLWSRGIGEGQTLPVPTLDFTGGSVTRTDLAPRELAYYKVTVPAGQMSWQVKLTATVGEVALAVRKDALPNIGAAVNWFGSSLEGGGLVLEKAGNEHYVLLPSYDTSNGQTMTTIPAGDYYLAVISQGGTNVGATTYPGPRIGTGNASYTLVSRGNVQTAALGAVAVGGADLMQAGSLEGGEMKAYTFTVPAGLASVQVSLENRTGNPWVTLPFSPDQIRCESNTDWGAFYGQDFSSMGAGYQNAVLAGSSFVTLANPAAGTYSVLLRAAVVQNNGNTYPDAAYTVRVQGQGTVNVPFDNGSSAVVDQAANTWRFFRIDVPAGVLGWDVRLVNVTSGSPLLVVRRDQLPASLSTPSGYSWPPGTSEPAGAVGWPSGCQWAPGMAPGRLDVTRDADLTRYNYSADGVDERGRILHLGMGRPLEPGTYYVGVTNASDSTAAMSYTLWSRGIGEGQSLPVPTLDFTGGSVTQTDLAPRELAYYKVTVPAGQMSWQVKLTATVGDVGLAVRKDTLPNIGAAVNWFGSSLEGGGVVLEKAGNEHYVLLPSYDTSNGQTMTTIPAGDYYLAVISQGGTNVGATTYPGPRIGTGNASYTLVSRGNVQTAALGAVAVGGADLMQAGSLEGGEMKAYTFTVPAGLASVQVSLENRTGNPWVTLPLTPDQVRCESTTDWAYFYGRDFSSVWAGYQNAVLAGSSFVTLANPAAGTYTVLFRAAMVQNNGNTYPDAAYTVRVQGQGTVNVPFDNGSSAVVDQAADTWRFFRIEVPAGVLGWDVRLVNVTSGSPLLVVRRDQLPASLSTPSGYSWPPGTSEPAGAVGWPSGCQWAPGMAPGRPDVTRDADLTRYNYSADGVDERGRILHLGMGRPLEAGTYYVGVTNASGSTAAMSYTLWSRGIGEGQTLPVPTLDFTGGSVTQTDLAPRELAYYKVTVPAGQMSWQVKLTATVGEVALAVRKDALPNIGAAVNWFGSSLEGGGLVLEKAGNEHYVLLPSYDTSNGQTMTTIPAGDYYLAVISQGGTNVGATTYPGPRIGTGNASYTLVSRGNVQTAALGAVAVGGADLMQAGSLEGGEMKAYTFTVPAGLGSVQVSLEDRTGKPWITLPYSPDQIRCESTTDWAYFYGRDFSSVWAGYQNAVLAGASFVTLANPAGTYTVLIRAAMVENNGNTYPDAAYTVRVHSLSPVVLNFSAGQNGGNGGTHLDSRSVGDGQIVYYRVELPATLDGQAVLGWRVNLALANGNAAWRMAKSFPPSAVTDGNAFASATGAGTLNLAPPFLTPGTWYVEVKGQGAATYTLSSENILLQRAAWVLPGLGEAVATPGLPAGGSEFADSGIRDDGTPLPDPSRGLVTDQGIDLANGEVHYYGFTMPANNAGLIRAELIAINGNPDLYVNFDTLPTSRSTNALDTPRSLTGTGTEYGAWPVRSTKTDRMFASGTVYLAVRAAGNTNARYRLKLSHGNPLADGVVQNLALIGGSYANQLLASGDWRYYRVEIPADAPTTWQISYSQVSGDVDLYLRDSGMPGLRDNRDTWPTGSYYDWAFDNKNQGPYPSFPTQGTYALAMPPLRPGHVYYLGFRATSDARFNLTSTATGMAALPPAIGFYGGSVTNVSVPANGSVTYRVELPADATLWKSRATNPADLRFYLEEGTPTDLARVASEMPHAQSNGAVNWGFNQSISSTNSWPWIAGSRTFYLTVVNSSAVAQTFGFALDGRNALTEDEDNDGLPDVWERQYFGAIYYTDGRADSDSDGSTDLQEYQNGTHPKDATSVQYQLLVAGVGATVAKAPNQLAFDKNATATLTATPAEGLALIGWAPTPYNASTGYAAAIATNPLPVLMDANKTVTAFAGLPLADALDTVGLTWTTGGPVLWVGQNAMTFDGTDAAKVTGLPAYGAEAWIETTVAAPGTLSWRWKLAEVLNGNSRIEFYVGTSLIRTLYSTTDWTQASYTVTGTGMRALRWRIYRETSDAAAVQDEAYLDTVSYESFSAPSALAATDVTAASFTANWSTVANATGYTLEVSSSENFGSGVATYSPGNVTAYAVTGRQPAMTYYYRVRAERGVDTSPNSNVIAVTTLVQLTAPVITTQPQSQAVNAGGHAELTVVATGNPAPTYQWRKEGATIADATSATLTLNDVQPGDAGNYTVEVTNPQGSVTSDAALVTVNVAPVIVTQPANQSAVIGGTAMFSVVATGTPVPTYQWIKDAATIAGATGSTLTLSNVQSADAGSYAVIVTNVAGSVTSEGATLAIHVPPAITSEPIDVTTIAGETATFTVAATGTAPLHFQWKKDGVAIAGATNATLTLAGVVASDAGSYTAVVTNSAGSATSRAATLTITGAGSGYTFSTLATGFSHPNGIALDPSGNVYVADSSTQSIRRIGPGGVVSLFAGGGGVGSADGTGTGARFFNPIGIASDRAGNLYVADNGNHTLRKITPTGVVTTLAGTAGQPGNTDATGTAARFNSPHGVAVDTAGAVIYVADAFNSAIRKIDVASGAVTTLAGLYAPAGVAVDGFGTVYASSPGLNIIVKITPAGVVTTFAGASAQPGSADGVGTAARFRNPREVAVDGIGNLFVADSDNQLIRKITADGTVTTIGGAAGQVGNTDGVGGAARFNYPTAITVSGSGVLYVAEEGGSIVRQGVPLNPAPTVTSVNAASGVLGTAFTYTITATNLPASFGASGLPAGLAVNSATGVISGTPTAAGAFIVALTATNGTGTGTASLDLTIAARPVITSQPASQAVFAGESATFTVVATGTPSPACQWRKGEVEIVGATGMTLTLPNVQLADAGSYTVVVANAAGSVTSAAAVLTVSASSLPAIVSPPEAVSVIVGQTATLTVTATGTPAPTYQWQKDDIAIPGATSPTLALDNVQPANAGSYSVVVTNVAGSVTSGAVTLTVHVPPVITTQPASVTKIAGEAAAFTVVATGTPAPTCQWRKGGAAINGATEATLSFAAVAMADAGEYDVVISNAAGSITSTTVTLTVQTTPAITTQPANGIARPGQSAAFTVVATGTAPLSYQWRKNGSDIGGGTAATLTLANVQASDAASYTVVVTNTIGSVTSRVAVLVVIDATHAIVGNGYTAGGTVTIANTITYAGTLSGLGWSVLPPAGWSYASGSGSEGDVKPNAGDTSLLEWAWTTIPASPVTFSYTLNVPAGTTGTKDLAALVLPRQSGTQFQVLVQPDPLAIDQVTHHAADTNRDFRISLTELLRVIELYNTRYGTVRTGAYVVDAGNLEDGFGTDPARSNTAVVTLTRYHSGDINHDAKLSLTELLRVIELYNTRSGTVRTGQYHVQAGTEDGFDTGP